MAVNSTQLNLQEKKLQDISHLKIVKISILNIYCSYKVACSHLVAIHCNTSHECQPVHSKVTAGNICVLLPQLH